MTGVLTKIINIIIIIKIKHIIKLYLVAIKMGKKQLGITFAIVLAIFLIGFFVRLDYITPYCVELVSKNKIEKRYVDTNSDFCVIALMDYNKAVVIDKNFENSMFTKLFLEKSGNTYLKPVYKNQSAAVWE